MKNSSSDDFIRFYEEFVRAVAIDAIFFRFIVVDTNKLDGGRMTEQMQLKFMYLLITRSLSFVPASHGSVQPNQLHILFDAFKESAESRDEGWRRKTRGYIERYLGSGIEHLQPCDSKINSLPRTIDLFTGLVSQVKNEGTDSVSESRKRLLQILYGYRFTVWGWKPYPKQEV